MPAARKRPADFTGQQTAKLQESRKAEIIEASQRIALVNAELQEEAETPVDYTDSDEPMPTVVARKAELNSPFRMIRVSADIDQMTYGRTVIDSGDYDNPDFSQRRPAIMGPMNMYTFKEGQLYRVSRELADHLQARGYISYIGGI
jgi:hypothetical protein